MSGNISEPDASQAVTVAPETPPESVSSPQSVSEECPQTPPQQLIVFERTPVKAKLASLQQHKVKTGLEKETECEQAATEMNHAFVQVELDTFSREFVSGDDPTLEERSLFLDFSDVKLNGTEAEMYPGFCKASNSVFDVLPRKDFVMKDTADWPDLNGSRFNGVDGDLKPDVGIYPTTKAAVDEYKLTDTELNSSKANKEKDPEKQKVLDVRRHHMARVSWNWLCVPFEFKRGNDNVPFEFVDSDPEKMLKNTSSGKLAQGQISEYAAQLLLRQHRTFTFMVFIAGPNARFLRWDRAGAVVSAPFNYVTCPDRMQTFIYRLGKMTDVQRGYDFTVQSSTLEDIQEMKKQGEKLSGTRQKYFHEATLTGWPIHRIQSRAEDFVTSRATKGYVAYDVDTAAFVFLKDSWRVDSEDVRSEKEVYERLHYHNVRHIATLICAGDVGETIQRTRTQEFKDSLDGRVHCRLVVKQIGRLLEDYEKSKEMVSIVRDALTAHCDAWVKAGVLHRDISPGNILIDDDPDFGGEEKLKQIESGKRQFQLQGEESLENLLSKLMKICQEHYTTVDRETWDKLTAPPNMTLPPAHEDEADEDDSSSESDFGDSESSSDVVVGDSKLPRRRPLLADHKAMKRAFRYALGTTWRWSDKLEDQFASFKKSKPLLSDYTFSTPTGTSFSKATKIDFSEQQRFETFCPDLVTGLYGCPVVSFSYG
ncbi:hypothetical protein B0H21DRAFT_860410 [Amylocystis lapponica]|nr:hypothetical protein B0H21DRAFT_860410 [Amylocystis lapponica]